MINTFVRLEYAWIEIVHNISNFHQLEVVDHVSQWVKILIP